MNRRRTEKKVAVSTVKKIASETDKENRWY